MTYPSWLPECPEGWSEVNIGSSGICFERGDGAVVVIARAGSVVARSKDGECMLNGQGSAMFLSACVAVGLLEWKPEPWEARVSRAIKRIGEEYDRMTDEEFAAHVESSYTGEFDGLFHGLDVGDWGGER